MGAALQKSPRLDDVFENFLATGNIPTTADLGLMQDSGYYNISLILIQLLIQLLSSNLWWI